LKCLPEDPFPAIPKEANVKQIMRNAVNLCETFSLEEKSLLTLFSFSSWQSIAFAIAFGSAHHREANDRTSES
jgi:hypothetical protein